MHLIVGIVPPDMVLKVLALVVRDVLVPCGPFYYFVGVEIFVRSDESLELISGRHHVRGNEKASYKLREDFGICPSGRNGQ